MAIPEVENAPHILEMYKILNISEYLLNYEKYKNTASCQTSRPFKNQSKM